MNWSFPIQIWLLGMTPTFYNGPQSLNSTYKGENTNSSKFVNWGLSLSDGALKKWKLTICYFPIVSPLIFDTVQLLWVLCCWKLLSRYLFMLGNSGTPCADRGCTDSCSEKGKSHWHNILRGSADCLHPRERFILLEIEKWYNKYMEEEDYIHSTLLPALTHSCWSCCNGSRAAAHGSSSSFSSSLHTLTFSLHLPLLSKYKPPL